MIIFNRRFCRKYGHDVDPSGIKFYCRRCHAPIDSFTPVAAARRPQCSDCPHRPHEGRLCGAVVIIDGCACPGPKAAA